MSKTKSKSSASAVSAAIQQARDELDRLDAEVGRLREQRSEVAGAPLPRDEAIAAMRARVDAQAAEGNRHLDQVAEQVGRPGGAEGWDPVEALQRWSPGQGVYTMHKPLALALLDDALKAALERRIEADPRYDGDNVLTADQRTKRLAELGSEIEQAEARREQLEGELADAGFFGEAEPAAPEGGDQGMRGFVERYNRDRAATNRELERAGVTQRAQPRVIRAFEPVRRVGVGED